MMIFPKVLAVLTPLHLYLLLTSINEGDSNIGQRIVTIQLDGTQYYVSKMNPYSSEMNYFLAYQYCRSIGLQLVSFESQEKADGIAEYLKNAGYSQHDFWTSGNHLGSNMLLWMSTGLPFNATFNYMRKQEGDDPIIPSGPLPMGRKKRGGMANTGCIALKANELDWDTEDCSKLKEFICEQTRCYFYNYGSIPVSPAQGHFNRHKESSFTPSTTTASSTSTIASNFQTSSTTITLPSSTVLPTTSSTAFSSSSSSSSSSSQTPSSSTDTVFKYAASKSSYSAPVAAPIITTMSSYPSAALSAAETEQPTPGNNENMIRNNNNEDESNEVYLTTTTTAESYPPTVVDYQPNNGVGSGGENDDDDDAADKSHFESFEQQSTPVVPAIMDEESQPSTTIANRTRTTKTLETETSHSARIMPEQYPSSESFPWAWAKNILLEKPIMKKTVQV